jgi:hypothetical protein
MQDCFGINKYEGWTANKRQVYGVRGQGEKYKQFWKEFQYKVVWENDDWPWSYFSLNEEDEADFVSKWSENIGFCEREEGRPPYDSVLDAKPIDPQELALNIELGNILFEEIAKEINKSVIETICKKAING